ncbi:hypothetical protein [Bradyrhizobium niftali]|uniref:hypothetical protein n=1 Tax=Bradyrhizobium niftali TaxID=2560055 RepID=UPI00384B9D3D
MSEREILERLRADTRHALSHQRGTSLKFESESHPAQSELRKISDFIPGDRLSIGQKLDDLILLQCGMPAARNFDPLIKDQYDV